VDRIIGGIALKDPAVNEVLLEWVPMITSGCGALPSTPVAAQRATNTDLLERSWSTIWAEEFFINKAIGWSLRDYSKTDPDWVRSFLAKYKNQMASLSVREASKYV
jgi:hypothetical protein